MKALTLTQEQKNKLLEMCNKLFSLEGVFFTINNGKLYYSKDGKYPGKSMHWFEFCMLYIYPKVQAVFDANQLANFYYVIFGYKKKSQGDKGWDHKRFIHPVDYLYQEFLKLK